MAQPKRVLIPMSSHDDMGISGIKTGSWFEEVATPYYEFLDAGFQVVFASPKGGRAPIDALSMQAPFTTANTDRFLDDPVGMRAISHTAPLQRLDGDVFDALFFPGGYGLLWDLASDSQVIRLIERFVAQEKPVAMVCHAPGILRDAKASNGGPLVKGHRVTGSLMPRTTSSTCRATCSSRSRTSSRRKERPTFAAKSTGLQTSSRAARS